jgi:hypothetical protein
MPPASPPATCAMAPLLSPPAPLALAPLLLLAASWASASPWARLASWFSTRSSGGLLPGFGFGLHATWKNLGLREARLPGAWGVGCPYQQRIGEQNPGSELFGIGLLWFTQPELSESPPSSRASPCSSQLRNAPCEGNPHPAPLASFHDKQFASGEWWQRREWKQVLGQQERKRQEHGGRGAAVLKSPPPSSHQQQVQTSSYSHKIKVQQEGRPAHVQESTTMQTQGLLPPASGGLGGTLLASPLGSSG